MKVKNFTPSEHDKRYLLDVLQILKIDTAFETQKELLRKVIQQYETVPVNGLIRNKLFDISCHYGLYQSALMSYRFASAPIDFDAGKTLMGTVLELLQAGGDIEVPENIYQLYQNRIVYEGETIEVEELYSSDWNFKIFKATSGGNYYFDIMLNQSAAYWNKVSLVPAELIVEIESAISGKNETVLNSIADRLKSESLQ
jgi:hypothetical protein